MFGRLTLFAALAMALGAAACSSQRVSSDGAELSNMWRGYLVPKSSPATIVGSFERYCAKGSGNAGVADAQLRRAGFVPLPQNTQDVTAYVVDDQRPAIGISPSMCLALAESRTGQTAEFRSFVAGAYPAARKMDPAPLGRDIEEAWFIPSDPPAIIATERTESFGWYRYALILYQPGRA